MSESNPYMALPDENRNHNRGSVSERNRVRMLWSLGFSVSTLICMVVMAILVDYHQPPSPNLVGDRFPLYKVVVPVSASSLSFCLAVLLVIPVVLTGNLRPAYWLIPTSFGLLWFVYTYDWVGLLEFGRPHHHNWRDPIVVELVSRRFGPLLAFLIAGLSLAEWRFWLNRSEVAKAEAETDAAIRKIVEEQTQSVRSSTT